MLLGIEIGGTKLQLGLGHGNGTLEKLVTVVADPSGGASRIRSQILDAYRGMDVHPSAAGVGFGGPVDATTGVVVTSHQVEGWDRFPLADWIRSELGIPHVVVQNDADTAALGEARFGAGVGLSPVLYVNSGSGIGGGLIIDGRIYRGSGLGAMEIGHLIMHMDADPDLPRPRSLESLASGWAIARAGRDAAARDRESGRSSGEWPAGLSGDLSGLTAATVAELARRAPDGEAAAILHNAAVVMGQALAHAITLLSPRRVILGGGVSMIHESLWLAPIRRTVDELVFPPFKGRFDIVRAALGQDVVVHGALALALDVI